MTATTVQPQRSDEVSDLDRRILVAEAYATRCRMRASELRRDADEMEKCALANDATVKRLRAGHGA